MRAAFVLFAFTLPALGQWTLQESHSTAGLRGIHSIGNGVAWASGSGGTVLRTVDGGKDWQRCAVPDGGEKLDFRGVQAFDADHAIVMSSGKGDLSRLYKTANGCKTWTLLFTNPDTEGFWDAISATASEGFIIGDPVDGKFAVFASKDSQLEKWTRFGESCFRCPVFDQRPFKSETMFAASNSILAGFPSSGIFFVSGGKDGAFFHGTAWNVGLKYPATSSWTSPLPLARGEGAGAFSFSGNSQQFSKKLRLAVVGGNYSEAATSSNTAAYSKDGGVNWKAAETPPHGYRSAVAYSALHKVWITVGPNGTDVSTDDGRDWRPLRPSAGEAPDADQHWNALSLPFVVGAHGRIGVLREDALTTP